VGRTTGDTLTAAEFWCVGERLLREWGRALYFESVIGFRRVTHYPPDWRELPTAELEILSFTR
jgi:hypothetical protein